MGSAKRIFWERGLSEALRGAQQQIFAEIDKFDADYIMKVNVDELTAHLVDKHRVDPLMLDTNNICIAEKGETKIDKTNDITFGGARGDERVMVDGTFAEYAIPFSGDPELFDLQPSIFRHNNPWARVVGSELRIRYEWVQREADTIKPMFDSTLEALKENVENCRKEIEDHNAQLADRIRPRIQARKDKAARDKGTVEALGYPIRPRPSAASSYAVTLQRRKVTIRAPQVSSKPFVPEPRLEMEPYERILDTISSMTLVMERCPSVFANIDEESLRQHLLVPLNALYEGKATGETFNREGKTDILIRENDRNIFIAECKFWTGPKGFNDAIDQLLSYTTWRDAKTALVVFNKNKDTSAVLKKIAEVAKAHRNYRGEQPLSQHGRLRFTFHHANDGGSCIIVTVLILDIPTRAAAGDK